MISAKSLFPDSTANVCGLVIKLDINDEILNDKYIPISDLIYSRYKKNKRDRQIFGLSGSSGSGKSVLASIISRIFKKIYDVPFFIISIDGFHYYNNCLISIKDKKGIETGTLKDFKGRYDTYDTVLLNNKLNGFLSDADISFPEYSRQIHDPIPDKIIIDCKNAILLIEGLWIFSDYPGWKEIKEKIDYKIFISSEEKVNRERVIRRFIIGGRTREQAEAHYNRSDRNNFDLVEFSKGNADKVINL
ncbi:MAG: hypothetical protein ABIA63_03440 [bacterium]